jgi:hypothetical protein
MHVLLLGFCFLLISVIIFLLHLYRVDAWLCSTAFAFLSMHNGMPGTISLYIPFISTGVCFPLSHM